MLALKTEKGSNKITWFVNIFNDRTFLLIKMDDAYVFKHIRMKPMERKHEFTDLYCHKFCRETQLTNSDYFSSSSGILLKPVLKLGWNLFVIPLMDFYWYVVKIRKFLVPRHLQDSNNDDLQMILTFALLIFDLVTI